MLAKQQLCLIRRDRDCNEVAPRCQEQPMLPRGRMNDVIVDADFLGFRIEADSDLIKRLTQTYALRF